MNRTLNTLALAFFLLSTAVSAETFEANGVVTDISLARALITVDEDTYQLPNKVSDANSNSLVPVIYQLQVGSVVRVTGDDATQRIDSLAILHQPTAEELLQQEPAR